MDSKNLLQTIYAAFNRRDVQGALEHMTDDVRWPKASEGGYVQGKEAIEAYWKRQWAEFNPNVEPLEIREEEQKVEVTVHQLVKDLRGNVLSDQTVTHTYFFQGGKIACMDVSGIKEPAFERWRVC